MKNLAFLFCFLAALACRKKTTQKQPDLAPLVVETVEKADVSAEKEAADQLVLEFKRTPCFGSCPAFHVQIFRNGRAEYDGFRFAKRTGKFTATASGDWLLAVQKAFVAGGIFGMVDAYPTDGRRIMDVPTTTTFFNGKRIEDNYDAPLELRKFETFLDQKIEELEWRAVR